MWPSIAAVPALLACVIPSTIMQSSTPLPPSFDSDDRTQSFHAWLLDVIEWCAYSKLEPPEQTVLLITRLEGTARTTAQYLSSMERMHGGIVSGRHLDPVTYLISGLLGFVSHGIEQDEVLVQ